MAEIKRLDEIDILKAIGIILMVMGHIGFGSIFDYWIHAFHMPMFYLISGFLYKRKNTSFKEFANKKIKTLMLPYLSFGILHYLIWLAINFETAKGMQLFNPLYHLLVFNTDELPISGALWFLTSLLFVDLIYLIIDKQKNKLIKNISIVCISLIGCIIPIYMRLPLALDTSFMAIGLFHIGTLLRQFRNILKNSILKGLVIFVIGSILSFVNGYVNVRMGIYSNIILYYCNAVLITVGLYLIVFVIMDKMFLDIKNELMFIGRNSIVYLCLNQLVILIVTKILSVILLPGNIIVLLTMKVMVFVISMIVLKIVSCILNTDKLKVFIGK